jgi:hypothetical protein
MRVFAFISLFLVSALSLMAQKEETLKIIVNDPSARVINANVFANCCSLYKTETSEIGKHIKIIEIDTSTRKCKCMCNFDLETDLLFLSNGHYIVDVYRRELVQFGYPEDKDIFIGRDSFDIVNNREPPLRFAFSQWDCDVSASTQDYTNDEPELATYPNPASGGAVNIDYNSETPGFVTLAVYNIFGSLVYSNENIRVSGPGNNTITFSSESLAYGNYTCIISNKAGRSKISRIVVLK